VQLDVAGAQLGVFRGLWPRNHRAFYQDNVFVPYVLCAVHYFGRTPVGIESYLDDPRPISQVKEHDAAKVAAAVNPPAQPDPFVDVGCTKRPAKVRPHCRFCHDSQGNFVVALHEEETSGWRRGDRPSKGARMG
jgi:hypothetical protein